MKPEAIVIHHSLTEDGQTVSWGAIRRYHTQELGWRDIGYHYGIEMVGGSYEVLLGRMMNETGAHCKQEGMNYKSLGICFVGNFDEIEVPGDQWVVGIKLVTSLCEVLGIGVDKIYGHREFASYKSCPGTNFDIDVFRAGVAQGLTL